MIGTKLPLPRKDGPTGLLCPVCATQMKYQRANADSWLIGCLTAQNEHNWKTWKCNQLNHKIALINFGVPRPIVSTYLDWGPRISPQGQILEDAPLHGAEGARGHPYARPAPGRAKKRTLPALQCKRIHKGSLSQNHKKAANQGCASQYCVGCCNAYSLVECRVHPRLPVVPCVPSTNAHGLTDQQLTALGITPQQLAAVGVIQAGTSGPSNGTIPSSPADTLGRRVPFETMAMIQRNRAQRDEAAERRTSSQVDITKVATIHLWVNSVKSQRLDAFFPQWPLYYLDQSELLLEAVHKAVGPLWNRALSIWDPKLKAWCDTLVNYPRRNPTDQRTIIVRLQSAVVPQSALPSRSTSGPLPPASAFLSKTSLPPICDTPSSPGSPGHSQRQVSSSDQLDAADPPKPLCSSQQGPPLTHGAIIDLTTDLPELVTAQPLEDPVPSNPDITVAGSPDAAPQEPANQLGNVTDNSGSPDKQEPSKVYANIHEAILPLSTRATLTASCTTLPRLPNLVLAQVLQKGWPSSSVPIAKILAWYKDQQGGNAPQRWKEHFGGEWKYVEGTMY
ncbi:uncharacterized protein MELLADRAFT_85840 [Melampsora larici-populina 98AG31]|uniref:Uncharacterized protein n=1 Tax=Melampsora larici-populina (strain 98AG31 / pathotype 3-4-7) TaxID=747676 RepID=F4RJY9_MELLP|nr:uncharacterized protein MELLADRAFT_85840 [Melampsora larici-populina 98AG31]EGG07396.1 hypothetical protein MELLADRAFT_85840 [Melampsora larici-populina 98AG31]